MTDVGSDVIELTKDLVAIDSQNPSLVQGAAGEAEIAAFIADWAAGAGLASERFEATPGRPSVLVKSATGSGGRTLLLCGHSDTVGTSGMSCPLTPTIDGDRLYGRGAYDMKAGLAAALITVRETARAGLSGQVVVACVADEEHSSLGVQELLAHVTADAAIVTEPTELTVATSHRGFVWIEIDIVGLAAHGSRPHLGRDAILKTGPILVALHELNGSLRRRSHPRLGSGFLHGSLIHGGQEESTIPDRCLLTVERRTLPGETLADVQREIDEVITACRTADPELDATARTTLTRPPFEVPDDADIVRTLARAATSVLGGPAELTGMSYWADSAFIAQAGIPTALFGPPGDGAHAAVEWVSVRGTIATAQTLVATANAFLS